MNKIIIFFIYLIFITGCSFNENSKFWTTSQNIKEDYEKYKNDFDVIIFVNENLNEFITTTKNNYNTKYKSDIDIEKII